MLDLESAIKHCEEVAEEQDKLCKRYNDASGYTQSHNEDIRTIEAKQCEKCAKEHRQLAEWLKDYKRLKDQKPCEGAISRQAVLDLCDKRTKYNIPYEYYEGKKHIRGWDEGKIINFTKLMQLPPVTPQPKTGHWIVLKDEYGDIHEAICSNCDDNGNHKWKYCPNCGVKMEVEIE